MRDPHKTKRYYDNWKQKGKPLELISKPNKELIWAYIDDLEKGRNVSQSHKKGQRSVNRIMALKSRIRLICYWVEQHYKISNIKKVSEEIILDLFSRIRSGEIKNNRGKKYKDTDSLAESLKSFWHWLQRVEKKKGKHLIDVTVDLSRNENIKPNWVYLNETQFKEFADSLKYDKRVMCWFVFDSGVRAPKELMNIQINHLKWDDKNNIYVLNIPDDVSKTFGRKIKLMLCSKMLKDYIKHSKLKDDDYLFSGHPNKINEALKRKATTIFGDKKSEAGEYYKKITLYDMRHCSACYWLPRYKTESAMKYRFGWKKSDKIFYYSEFLGMKDTIKQEDLYVHETSTELEKQLESERKERLLMQEMMQAQQEQIKKLEKIMKAKENEHKLEAKKNAS